MNDKTFPRRGSQAPLSAFKHLAQRVENARKEQGSVDATNAHTLSRCSSDEARNLLPYEQAIKLKVLPLGIISLFEGKVLSVAAPTLRDAELVSALKFATGYEVKLVPTKLQVLMTAIHFAYRGSEKELGASLQKVAKAEPPSQRQASHIPDFRPAAGDIAQLLASLVDYALSRGASDIHLVPLRDGGHVRMRVQGELFRHEAAFCSLENHAKIISRLKVLAALDVTLRSAPQDGSFSIPIQDAQVFARLSVMPTVHGEKAVIRLMNANGPLQLDELGLDERSKEMLERHAQRSEGSIIFAGPTGSGKTTSMYALLQNLVAQNLSVVSIEDPVEIQIPGVAQTSVDEKRELGFSSCLRSILRQDPDVILLGEMRDEESAKIALQAALTGHLLLTTVHARD
ncbi:MAG: Flp pilus assembly complex ATPase component TadA, partial [Deltaproteobacteria bacterium]|nr:Flp pilus assembly complex ATPase component TadA [Deltaproteobacteria bacterium]